MEYYSVIKKNEIMSFAATWLDLQIIILSEVSHTEKQKYYIISHMCNLENIYQEKKKKERKKQTQRTNLWLPGEKGEEEG